MTYIYKPSSYDKHSICRGPHTISITYIRYVYFPLASEWKIYVPYICDAYRMRAAAYGMLIV